jgi:DNA gyrase subunit A
VAAGAYRAQLRGGRGVSGMAAREEDAVRLLFAAQSLDTLLFFTDKGKVYSEKAHRMPDAGRAAKGIPLANLVNLGSNERVTAALAVPDFEKARFLTMLTRQGKIKRAELAEFEAVRASGLLALNLDAGDALGWVKLTSGDDEVVIVSEGGQAIRFAEAEVRPMGRTAGGVMAIKLGKGDRVAAMDVADPQGHLVVVTAKGFAKRTPLKEYSTQGRNGQGIVTLNKQSLASTGRIADARVVNGDNDIIFVSAEGMVFRTRLKEIPQMARATRGAKLVEVKGRDAIVSLALVGIVG